MRFTSRRLNMTINTNTAILLAHLHCALVRSNRLLPETGRRGGQPTSALSPTALSLLFTPFLRRRPSLPASTRGVSSFPIITISPVEYFRNNTPKHNPPLPLPSASTVPRGTCTSLDHPSCSASTPQRCPCVHVGARTRALLCWWQGLRRGSAVVGG